PRHGIDDGREAVPCCCCEKVFPNYTSGSRTDGRNALTASITAARGQRGPVAPSPDTATLRPLQMSGVELMGPSLWADWRRRNTEVTIPLGIAALEQAGNLANLTRLIDASPKPHVGFPFSDTDVYKTLEAIAWAGHSATPGLLGEFFANTVALLEK